MELNKPILSICIPTYNRSVYLEKSIKSIIKTDEFKNGKIEIVISDNCSTDNTEEMTNNYTSKYKNIKYYKNEKNVKDLNFAIALERGSGIFRKLSNDTIIYIDDSLKYMIDTIENNIHKKPVIFFVNEEKKYDGIIQYNDLDSVIKHLGRNITWLPVIGMWDEDIDLLNFMREYSKTQLSQVVLAFELFLKHKMALIVNKELMKVQSVDKKNLSYSLYNVFYKNYLGIVNEYLEKKKVLLSTYEYLKKELLFEFFLNWIIIIELNSNDYLTYEEDLKKLVENEYKEEIYFNKYKKEYKKRYTKYYVKKQIKRFFSNVRYENK